jgi:hypothetical protein
LLGAASPGPPIGVSVESAPVQAGTVR